MKTRFGLMIIVFFLGVAMLLTACTDKFSRPQKEVRAVEEQTASSQSDTENDNKETIPDGFLSKGQQKFDDEGTNGLMPETIKIGVILPMTGPVAAYGAQCANAIRLKVDHINETGGINGALIELIIEDDEANPDKTKAAFTKLAEEDAVIAVIGALTSKCTLAIADEAQARKIPLITPSSTNDILTDVGNYFFRACYNDSFQGQALAKFAFERMGTKKAAILFDSGNDYSKGIARNFVIAYEKQGGTIVATESYQTGDQDFSTQIANLKAQSPDVILVSDYYMTVSMIGKQVRAAGITVPMMGADGWDEISNIAGDEMLGSYYSNHFSPESTSNETKTFMNDYTREYNETPNVLAALGYDAMSILADALEKAGKLEPEKIRTAMMDTDGSFVTGTIRYKENGDPIKSMIMLEIVKSADGKLGTAYAGTVEP